MKVQYDKWTLIDIVHNKPTVTFENADEAVAFVMGDEYQKLINQYAAALPNYTEMKRKHNVKDDEEWFILEKQNVWFCYDNGWKGYYRPLHQSFKPSGDYYDEPEEIALFGEIGDRLYERSDDPEDELPF